MESDLSYIIQDVERQLTDIIEMLEGTDTEQLQRMLKAVRDEAERLC